MKSYNDWDNLIYLPKQHLSNTGSPIIPLSSGKSSNPELSFEDVKNHRTLLLHGIANTVSNIIPVSINWLKYP
ncbi:MAG TPA: hypothetical protein VN704_04000 [Verrucomicrobiae bacterium]|nr:hypothetical protein [Verrucomicrobiae bacterium]